METLPDTFCVFILTHGRPDNVITLKTLEKCGYTGRLYLVVDNEDKTIDRYRRNFGAERVIVFDKQAEADDCDEGNNFDEHRTILMARNACFKIAEQLGVTHFIELDDDYTKFEYRYESQEFSNQVSSWLVKNITPIFLSFLNFYKTIPAKSIAFSQGGDHIGGFCGVTQLRRKCMNSFFCSTERPFQFIGAMNEDVNTYTVLGNRGDLFFTFTSIQLTQKATQSQDGGITGMYRRFGTYCKAFTTVMMLPSAVKVSMMQSNNPRIHHAISWKQAVPCIISEKYRKEKTIQNNQEVIQPQKSKVSTPRHVYDPAEHPAPPVPDAAAISTLADMVMAGKIVSASLNDGTYITLMRELNRRGYGLTARTEIEKQTVPWLLRVAPIEEQI